LKKSASTYRKKERWFSSCKLLFGQNQGEKVRKRLNFKMNPVLPIKPALCLQKFKLMNRMQVEKYFQARERNW